MIITVVAIEILLAVALNVTRSRRLHPHHILQGPKSPTNPPRHLQRVQHGTSRHVVQLQLTFALYRLYFRQHGHSATWKLCAPWNVDHSCPQRRSARCLAATSLPNDGLAIFAGGIGALNELMSVIAGGGVWEGGGACVRGEVCYTDR